MTRRRVPARKPFPWTCPACGKRAVGETTLPYTFTAQHDNKQFEITIDRLEAPRCSECGEVVFDRVVNARLSDAIRERTGLLRPEEIRQHIELLGITQKQLADELHVAQETLSRWVSGSIIQSYNNDQRLRSCLARLMERKSTICESDTEDRQIDFTGPQINFESLWSDNVRETQAVQDIVCQTGSTWGKCLCLEDK
jgi:transcriptional regulator with XRE-family HTH domain